MQETTRQLRLIVTTLSLLLILTLNFPLNAEDTQTPKIPCDFVGFQTRPLGLLVGDKVSAKDAQGNTLAECLVEVDGQYGFLTVSLDNQDNKTISFYINGVEQEKTGAWQEGKLLRVDLGTPKTPLSIEITSPEAESVVNETTFSIDIQGYVNNKQAQVEVIVNQKKTFTPQVNPDGTFLITDVNLLGGSNTIQAKAEDPARNTADAQVGLYQGWVLHLKDMPWYEKEKHHYSGAATCKMILDYLCQKDEATGKSQDELYDYGYLFNSEESAMSSGLDADAVDAILGHFDPYDDKDNPYDQRDGGGNPYHAYNFGVDAHERRHPHEYLGNIAHWMAYPVTVKAWWLKGELVARPNSPAAVPVMGSYSHWVAVNGVVASSNPAPNPHDNPFFVPPELIVYGLWLSDPTSPGIGKDVYVTASDVINTYFAPMCDPPTKYTNKYIQVAEPPKEKSQLKAEIAPEKISESGLNLIKIAQSLEALSKVNTEDLNLFEQRLNSFKSHLYDTARGVELDQSAPVLSGSEDLSCLFQSNTSSEENCIIWQEIIEPQALTDEDFREAIEGSIVREFIKVERKDGKGSYYIIPFDKHTRGQFLTYAAIIVDAATGAFKQASWVEEPVRFVPITKSQAQNLALDYARENLGQHRLKISSSELVWQPKGLSNSPFSPYWKVSIGKHTLYVTQEGDIHKDND